MTLLLDTATLAPADRNDALTALYSAMTVPSIVSHDSPDDMVFNTTHFWPLGPVNGIIRAQDTGLKLSRTADALRSDGRETYALSFQHLGTSVYLGDDGPSLQRRGTLHLENCAMPREFAYEGTGDKSSFLLSPADLGLPTAVVAEASSRLGSSPAYRMVQAHFSRLADAAERIPAEGDASAFLASASIQLVRLLVAGASPENRLAREVVRDTELTALEHYVRRNLHDSTLTSESIAAANHISVRQLYKIWAAHDQTLHDWIMQKRLENARADLAAPESVLVTIEVVARRWGFTDASHFSRRFRDAYDCSPREWRMARVG